MLLREKLGALGTSVGLIQGNARVLAQAYVQWMEEILGEGAMRSSDLNGAPESLIASLLPLVTPVPSKALFLETLSGHCAFFNNFRLGPDVMPAMQMLAKRLSVPTIRATCSPAKLSLAHMPATVKRYPANILEISDANGDMMIDS